jgi:hypothetical protein
VLRRLGHRREVLTEALTGWRTWRVAGSRDGTEVRLHPIAGTGKGWPAREPVRAECAKRRFHRVPGERCTCGIYASRHVDLLRRTRDPAVLGTVAVWGRVLEHEHGYRAEFGYPQRIGLVCRLCFWRREVGRATACDVVVRHRGGAMVPFCSTHLELARRYGYPARRMLEAEAVERGLLDAYAVDTLWVPTRTASVVGSLDQIA